MITRTLMLVLTAGALTASAASKNKQRLEDAVLVLQEIMAVPEKGIPANLLDRAHCIVIVPGLKKGAFFFGGRYGKGYTSCRQTGKKGWSAPATLRVEGGSFGLQIGVTETDVVMLVMNERGANSLMGSKFTLGGVAQAAAGPVGRAAAAETDAAMRAEILSYSRSRGLFAGVALQGATMRNDLDANRAMYDQRLTTAEIVREDKVKPTPAGQQLIDVLTGYSATS
jgi:lipid-binding SYLF domain-containing protein